MNYTEIGNEVDEILNSISFMNLRMLEDSLDRLDELNEFLEVLAEKDESEDDTEYQEIAEMIEDAKNAIETELDSEYEDDEEDYY